MAKVLVNRTERNIIIKSMLNPNELLDVITIEEIMAYYSNKQYMILDRIGKEAVMEYFNLIENNGESTS